MKAEKRCTIAVRVCGQERAALEVCIRNSNVYVNYFGKGRKKHEHTSYHTSGQKHTKKNGDYFYRLGISGKWEQVKRFKTPPRQLKGREDVCAISFVIASLASVLPLLKPHTRAEILELPPEFTEVGFAISVVGADAQSRDNIHGFPIFWRCRVSDAITVEVEAFGFNQTIAQQVFLS